MKIPVMCVSTSSLCIKYADPQSEYEYCSKEHKNSYAMHFNGEYEQSYLSINILTLHTIHINADLL
jgi:hypothetical protein